MPGRRMVRMASAASVPALHLARSARPRRRPQKALLGRTDWIPHRSRSFGLLIVWQHRQIDAHPCRDPNCSSPSSQRPCSPPGDPSHCFPMARSSPRDSAIFASPPYLDGFVHARSPTYSEDRAVTRFSSSPSALHIAISFSPPLYDLYLRSPCSSPLFWPLCGLFERQTHRRHCIVLGASLRGPRRLLCAAGALPSSPDNEWTISSRRARRSSRILMYVVSMLTQKRPPRPAEGHTRLRKWPTSRRDRGGDGKGIPCPAAGTARRGARLAGSQPCPAKTTHLCEHVS
jgi:hypothetical protein